MKDSSILFTGAPADDGRDKGPPSVVEQPARQNRRKAGRVGDWVARHPALAAFPFVLGAALLLWEAVVRLAGLSGLYSSPPRADIAEGADDERGRLAAAPIHRQPLLKSAPDC